MTKPVRAESTRVSSRVRMNRAQVLTVGLVTVLTVTCIGLIVAVARSNSAGGSGQALAGVRVYVVYVLRCVLCWIGLLE